MQHVIILRFDDESYQSDSNGAPITPEDLESIAKKINDEIAGFYYGYYSWETKFGISPDTIIDFI